MGRAGESAVRASAWWRNGKGAAAIAAALLLALISCWTPQAQVQSSAHGQVVALAGFDDGDEDLLASGFDLALPDDTLAAPFARLGARGPAGPLLWAGAAPRFHRARDPPV